MSRLIDVPLEETVSRIRSIVRQVDYGVSDALITLKDPSFLAVVSSESREREVSRLVREFRDHVSYTFARFPPVANDLRFLMTAMKIAADLEHMLRCAGRIREGALSIGLPSASLLRLALVTQRQVSECCSAAYHFRFPWVAPASGSAADRLKAIVAGRREAAALFKKVVTEPGEEHRLLGAIADELERVADLAASIAEQLI
jgi:phosphate uptake regulator